MVGWIIGNHSGIKAGGGGRGSNGGGKLDVVSVVCLAGNVPGGAHLRRRQGDILRRNLLVRGDVMLQGILFGG
jgi:hypothetical protein